MDSGAARYGLILVFCALALPASGELKVAAFRADMTPSMGEPLIWVKPTTEVMDPLWAKGVVLDDGKHRYVVCAVDWCGIGGTIYEAMRAKIAAAAGTDVSRVALQSVHQHTAPYVDGGAYEVMRREGNPPLLMSQGFLDLVGERLTGAVKQAVGRMEPFDHVGTGKAEVERVASARRIQHEGKLLTRFSTGAKDPLMAELPEGAVDREIRTITFARGKKAIARLHYYASHPQTFCCDGRVTGDFVGAARERVENREKVPQVYFTGCAGNVTAGKYNDGSVEARNGLAKRMEAGIEASCAATLYEPVRSFKWRTAALRLPAKPAPGSTDPAPEARYRAALGIAFANTSKTIETSALEIGRAVILHLPGEPFLEYQQFAQSLGEGRFVAVAGYGNITPGYLCIDQAYGEGGYEPSASYTGPGTEAAMKEVIKSLLKR
jgi:hypothetical protein